MAHSRIQEQGSDLAQRYTDALRAHLRQRRAGSLAPARAIGREALRAGLDARSLARLHEHSLVVLAAAHDFADDRNGLLRRTGHFLAETLAPLGKADLSMRESYQQLQQRTETLRLHTAELAAGNRRLNREIARRQAGEVALRKAKERYQLLFAQSQLMQTKLRRMARQILSAQEDERREISRELHDEVVQTLVGVNVHLAALGSTAALGSRALKAKIADTQRLVEKSVSAVHKFARELRPAVLDDLGLIPALHAYLKAIADKRRLKIRLTTVAVVETLEKSRCVVLYRVAQEALTNIVRHAAATVVTMQISEVPGAIRMDIHDNGKSFCVRETLSPNTNKRLGLLGMRERVEMVGGVLAIESAPGLGTTVRAEIPFRTGGVT